MAVSFSSFLLTQGCFPWQTFPSVLWRLYRAFVFQWHHRKAFCVQIKPLFVAKAKAFILTPLGGFAYIFPSQLLDSHVHFLTWHMSLHCVFKSSFFMQWTCMDVPSYLHKYIYQKLLFHRLLLLDCLLACLLILICQWFSNCGTGLLRGSK